MRLETSGGHAARVAMLTGGLLYLFMALAMAAEPPDVQAQEPPAAAKPGKLDKPVEPPRVVLARVGDYEITVKEMMNYVSKDGGRRVRELLTPTGKAAVVRDMIANRLLTEAMYREELLDRDEKHTQRDYFEAYPKLAAKHFPLPPKPTVAELKKYYDEHPEKFSIPAKVRVRQILIRYPRDATEQQKQETRKRAEAVIARLKKGESFAAVAREVTDNLRVKEDGGDLGFWPIEYDPWLKQNLSGMMVGEYTGLLETPVGYEIMMLTDSREAMVTPFEQIPQGELISQLRLGTQELRRRAYVKRLVDEIGVEIVMEGLEGAIP